MLKRLICILISLLLLSSFAVLAGGAPSVSVSSEFYENTSRDGTEKAAKILGMNSDELNRYCEDNNILYIAVNSKNTKQIRITRYQNEFSRKINNLSNLNQEEIKSLIADISGTANATGEIVEKDLQSFILTSQSSSDSGGDYILTRYITIAEGLTYILSFYTSSGTDLNYTKEVFNTFTADDFHSAKTGGDSILIHAIQVCIIVLVIISFAIVVSIFLDCKHEYDNNKMLIGEDLKEENSEGTEFNQADCEDNDTAERNKTKEPIEETSENDLNAAQIK